MDDDMDDNPMSMDAQALGEWFKGGVRGGHAGMDALESNWSKDKFPPPEQLRLYADVSGIQVRRLKAVGRALRELGETP